MHKIQGYSAENQRVGREGSTAWLHRPCRTINRAIIQIKSHKVNLINVLKGNSNILNNYNFILLYLLHFRCGFKCSTDQTNSPSASNTDKNSSTDRHSTVTQSYTNHLDDLLQYKTELYVDSLWQINDRTCESVVLSSVEYLGKQSIFIRISLYAYTRKSTCSRVSILWWRSRHSQSYTIGWLSVCDAIVHFHHSSCFLYSSLFIGDTECIRSLDVDLFHVSWTKLVLNMRLVGFYNIGWHTKSSTSLNAKTWML